MPRTRRSWAVERECIFGRSRVGKGDSSFGRNLGTSEVLCGPFGFTGLESRPFRDLTPHLESSQLTGKNRWSTSSYEG